MKKLSIIAVAVAAVMLFAIPAMALDVDFSGAYRVRGIYMDNTDLNDNTGNSDAYMDMRFRLQTVFKVHDNLKVTTRFDALDNKIWGSSDSGNSTVGDVQNDNIDFDQAYLTATFDMFTLDVGRMSVGNFGTAFLSEGTEGDQIQVSMDFEPFSVAVGFEKGTEMDDGWINDADNGADMDDDTYFVDVEYSAEGMDAGIELAYTNNKTGTVDEIAELLVRLNAYGVDTTELDALILAAGFQQKYWTINPYLKGTFGPVKVQSEIGWKVGDWIEVEGGESVDYDAWAFMLDVGMDFGPAFASVGYAHTGGQDFTDDDFTVYGLGGNDWEPLLILTSYYNDRDLGDAGNLNSTNGAITQFFGYDLFYLKGTYALNEDISINGIVAFATADEVPDGTNMDDDYGWELDVGVDWKIMDNLNYKAIIGFYQAGDFWQGGDTSIQVDDTYSVFNQLMVTF